MNSTVSKTSISQSGAIATAESCEGVTGFDQVKGDTSSRVLEVDIAKSQLSVKSMPNRRGSHNFGVADGRSSHKLKIKDHTEGGKVRGAHLGGEEVGCDSLGDANREDGIRPIDQLVQKDVACHRLKLLSMAYSSMAYSWGLPLVGGIIIILVINLLEPEQRDVLFSATSGWFVGVETHSLGEGMDAVVSTGGSDEYSTALSSHALLLLGVGMLCASFGWLQEFWADLKSRLISRSLLMVVALVVSLIALAFVRTKAEEVLALAGGISWILTGFCHRLVSFARNVIGRSAHLLSISPRKFDLVVAEAVEVGSQASGLSQTKAASKSCLVDARNLKVGDVIKLREGEQVPCDGTLVSGSAIVYEVRFSPLGRVVNRCEKDRVYAGSLVLKGECKLIVEEVFGDSDLSINLASLDQVLNEPINQDLEDYRLQRILIGLVLFSGAVISGLHWVLFSSISACLVICSAVLMGAVVVAVPTFFFPLRRLCLLRAYKAGALLANASSLALADKIENIIVDVPKGANILNCEVRSCRIFDDNLDKKAILDLILALLSRVTSTKSGLGDSFWCSLHDAIFKDDKFGAGSKPGSPVRLDSFCLSNRGLQGVIEGVPVFFGDVQFLLENNVLIDLVDVPFSSSPERVLLLAMGLDAIASMVVVPSAIPIEREDLKKLRELGYKVLLVSDAERKEVDIQGRIVGFELGSIHGGLSTADLEEKLRSTPSAAIFSARGVEADIDLTIVPFDEVRRELNDGDITLLSKGILPLVNLLIFLKQSKKMRRYFLWFGCFVSVLTSVIALIVPQGIWLGVVMGGAFNLIIYAFLRIMSPRL